MPSGTILGHEFAGEVVAIGGTVSGLKQGDLVTALPVQSCGRCVHCLAGQPLHCPNGRFAFGGFAEYLTARAVNCVKLPAGLSLADGALIEPLAVALHGIDLARPADGARILILGAGPIGLGVAFWCRQLGARRVAIAATSDRNAALASELGAGQFLAGAEDPPAAASEALEGAPDMVFECVGKPGLLAEAVECVAKRGTVLALGACGCRPSARADKISSTVSTRWTRVPSSRAG